jgi:hypothetical protein
MRIQEIKEYKGSKGKTLFLTIDSIKEHEMDDISSRLSHFVAELQEKYSIPQHERVR